MSKFFKKCIFGTCAALTILSLQAADGRFEIPKKVRKFNAIQYFPHAGKSISFGGDLLKWTGPGDCSQAESQMPMIEVQGDDITIRNAVIMNAPDGIHVRGKRVIIENVVFPDVCEDAITAFDADDLIIRNCSFRGARDKAIQINSGTNILIENCWFEDCSKPVRVKSGSSVTVRNNQSRGSKFFVFADGNNATVKVENNIVENSKVFVRAESDAKIAVSKNKLSRIKNATETSKGGVISGDLPKR